MAKTIAAVATPLAVGGISVIRISGPEAIAVADRVFSAASGGRLAEKKGYTAAFGAVGYPAEEDGAGLRQVLDSSVALVYRAPKSYTGEDVVELSCHGGIFVTREVLRAVLEGGAVLAGPGEFTKRAFLNGKLDLAEAEAVADLIGANNLQAMNAAHAQLDGALSRRIQQVQEKLLNLAGHLSAWVDYPEEDIPEVEEGSLVASLQEAAGEMERLLDTFDTGRLVKEGIDTVIAGKPNVGKSTLMNRLAGCKRSIVTDIAGTTRDIVEEAVTLGDIVLRLADMAGIHATEDPVEKLGVEIAEERLKTAALVLAVFDGSEALDGEDRQLLDRLAGLPVVAVVNKADLGCRVEMEELRLRFGEVVALSALEDSRLGRLEEAIKRKVRMMDIDTSAGMIATERQRECAGRALAALREGLDALGGGMTLDAVAVSIEEAVDALLELTGGRVTEEVVNNVFSHFCVGK